MRVAIPSQIEINPRLAGIDAQVQVPGSKSLSNRALLLAGLAQGTSYLQGLLESDDTRVMQRALAQLGVRFEGDVADELIVHGVNGLPEVPEQVIDVHASGTAARFLTAVLALVPGEARLDGTARMRQRPIHDLVDALAALGVDIAVEGERGCPPVRCHGGQPFGGEVEVDASKSSQYVSALLQIAPYAAEDVVLRLRDGVLVSRPYVDVTLNVMQRFGATARFLDDRRIQVSSFHRYQGRQYVIEPDASTAAYFFCAAAMTGGRIRVGGLSERSQQADMGVLRVLASMGAEVTWEENLVIVRGPRVGELRGVDVDMNAMPDAVLAVAVTAAFANGPSHIRNVANLRIKESDRLAALETELRKLGVDARADADALHIAPPAGGLRGAEIATYDDHRMAMAFALAGLRVPGVVILDPGCVSKSWPSYFEAFARI